MQTNKTIHRRAFMYFLVEACVILMLGAVQITTVHVMFRNHKVGKGILGF
jgi:hypothetical protein